MAGRGPGRWWRGVALVVLLAVTFMIVATIGAGQVRRGVRVFGGLDPVAAWLGSSGGALTQWLLEQATNVGWATSGAAGAIALLGLLVGRRRGLPLLLLATAVTLVVWGQIELLADRITNGVYLYLAGVVCAVGLGVWRPLTRIEGFPPWPFPGDRAPDRRGWPTWEFALVFGLTVVALLSRIYALIELPSWFDSENMIAMLSSRTALGLREYLPWGLLGNGTGAAHLLPQLAFLNMFGASVYALRLVAVLFGVTAVPLCYWLARRIAGTGPAVVATVLLIGAPEQLFWSRSENTFFEPIAVTALVTAHLGLWMTERVSPVAVLAAALWMPISRFCYAPAIVLFGYPVVLYGHAVVCVRGAWRKMWYAVPLLAGGGALWFFSLSFAYTYLGNWQWRFVNPTGAYSAAAMVHEGERRTTRLTEAVATRALSMAKNYQQVARSMAYHSGFSHWYVRVDESHHPTIISVGVFALAVLGLSYLLGQVYDRRAFALLFWVALGLMPAVLSDDPADRRMSAIFPALYITVGALAGVAVRLARQCAGRVVGGLTGGLVTVGVIAVVWTNVGSHFQLRVASLPVTEAFRFTQPLFRDSDVIFHSFDSTGSMTMVFGSLEDFLVRPPCYQSVAISNWLATALNPACGFKEQAYKYTIAPERIAALQAQPPGDRITFLLNDLPVAHSPMELLRALFPQGTFREFPGHRGELHLTALTIARADAQRLHAPALQVAAGQPPAADLAARILKGVTLAPSAEAAAGGVVVTGGVLIDRPDWYRFAVDPACAPAQLRVDGEEAAQLRPMLPGVHAFVLTLPDAAACALPLQLVMQPHAQASPVPITPEAIVSPAVAAVPAAQAPPVATYDGYGPARRLVDPKGRILDFGVDAQETVVVLVQTPDGYRVHRFSPDGAELGSWDPEAAQGYGMRSMAVAPDGRVLLRGERNVWVFDRDGHWVATWDSPRFASPEIAFLEDGRILGRVPDSNAIGIFDRNGQVQSGWSEFKGSIGHFQVPGAVIANPQGDILVVEESEGRSLLFHNHAGGFDPQFVREFQMAFGQPQLAPHGLTFDDSVRVLAPDQDARTTLVYGLDGQRLMAAQPERDLNTRNFGSVVRYRATPKHLYVLDEERRLWAIDR
jgi:hypothetical protein